MTDGLVAFVKRDCPTCQLVVPVLEELADDPDVALTVYTQDDPTFPAGLAPVDDTSLDVSFAHRPRHRPNAAPGQGRSRGRAHRRLEP